MRCQGSGIRHEVDVGPVRVADRCGCGAGAVGPRLGGERPELREWFEDVTRTEQNHDQFCVKDLKELGLDPKPILDQGMGPGSWAMVSQLYYICTIENPIGVLGVAMATEGLGADLATLYADILEKEYDIPHGATMDKWTPATEGAGFAFTETLKPLEKLRDRLVVVSNLAHPLAGGKGSDAGADHARSAAVFLSGAHPEKGTVHGGRTIDQVLADKIGQDTPLPSIEVCIEEVALNCGAGYGCSYYNTISWRTDTLPLPMENSPQVVFERLFGDGTSATPPGRLPSTPDATPNVEDVEPGD